MRGLLVVIALSSACYSRKGGGVGLAAGATGMVVGYAMLTSDSDTPNGVGPSGEQVVGGAGLVAGAITATISLALVIFGGPDDQR